MGLGSLIVSSVTKIISDKTNWNIALGVWALISLAVAVIWKMYMDNTKDSSEEKNIKINWSEIDIWKMIIFFGVQS